MDISNLPLLFEVKQNNYHIYFDKNQNSLIIYNSKEQVGLLLPLEVLNVVNKKLFNYHDKNNYAIH